MDVQQQQTLINKRKKELDLSRLLHFGAIISISPSNEPDYPGYIYSDGFIIKGISLQNFEKSTEDFCGSLFKVVPPYQYEIQKRLQEEVNALEENSHNFEGEKENQTDFQEIVENLDLELKNNSDKFQKLRGSPIIFSQQIQLEHIRSQKYLSFHPDQSARGYSDNFTLQLEDIPSEYTLFKVLPCYKYQNERDKFIKFDDDIYIASAFENMNKDAYLCLNKIEPGASSLNQPAKKKIEDDSSMENINSSDEEELGCEKKIQDDFIINFERTTKFKINVYSVSVEVEQTTQVMFGDIVWLSHIERDTCLEYRKKPGKVQKSFEMGFETIKEEGVVGKIFGELKFKGESKSPFEDKTKSEEKIKSEEKAKRARSDLKNNETLKQRSDYLFFEKFENKDVKNTIAMWKIEGEDYTKGGPVYWNNKIRFKNLSTGLYLSVKNSKNAESRINNLLNAVQSKETYFLTLDKLKKMDEESTLFILKNREKEGEDDNPEDQFVSSDSFFTVTNVLSDLSIGVALDATNNKNKASEKILWKPILKEEVSQEDVMRIYKAMPQEVWETRFMLSCLPIIRGGLKLVKKMNEEEWKKGEYLLKFSRKTGLELLKECLENVMNFCYHEGKSNSFISELNMDFGLRKPNQYRQRILREQNFIYLLANVVNVAFPEKHFLDKIEKFLGSQDPYRKRMTKMAQSRSSRLMSSRKSVWAAQRKTPSANETETIALFLDICRISYRLIQGICKDNYENELECFKYFSIFKKHIGHHLHATDCLISIVKDNEKLLLSIHLHDSEWEKYQSTLNMKSKEGKLLRPSLSNLHKQTLVHYFAERYEELHLNKKNKPFWVSLLYFYISICKYHNNGITVNQMLISEVLKMNSVYNNLLIPITCEKMEQDGEKIEKIVLVISDDEKPKVDPKEITEQKENPDLKELCQFVEYVKSPGKKLEEKKKLEKTLLFFEKQLELFALLCYGRNYVNKKLPIIKTLNVSVLISYIWNESLPSNIRAVLVSILLNVHIDNKPRTERILPMLTKTFASQHAEPAKKPLEEFFEIENPPQQEGNKLKKQNTLNMLKALHWMGQSKSAPKSSDKYVEIQDIKSPDVSVSSQERFILDKSGEEKQSYEKLSNKNVVHEFMKEEETISQKELDSLTNKILEYLQVLTEGSEREGRAKKYINFDSLLLNIVQLVKKLVLFECFTYSEDRKQKVGGKNVFQNLKTQKETNEKNHQFIRLLKCLIIILNCENKPVDDQPKEEVKKKVVEEKTIFSKIGETVVGFTSNALNLGTEIFSSTKIEKKKTRKAKRESFSFGDSDFYITGMNLKRKFLRMTEQQSFGKKEPTDVLVKAEILHILIFIMDSRLDIYLSNVIEFMREINENEGKASSNGRSDEDIIEKYIKTKFESHLPSVITHKGDNVAKFGPYDEIFDGSIFHMLLSLFQNSKDYHLNNLIMTLLFKCFSQRTQLVKSLKDIQILMSAKEAALFEKLKDKARELKFICEQSEVWLTTPKKLSDPQFHYKFVIYKVKDIVLELIKVLYNATGFDLGGSAADFTYDDSEISHARQVMMHNLKVHTIILKLLKDGSYVLEEIVEKDRNNQVIVEIFETCYEFLLKFCKNDNKENKKCLYKDLNIFVQHLEYFEVGQTNLINEIFKNNYKLSVQVSEELILAYFSKISSFTKGGGHNPKYLEFFDNIVRDKNELIKENCTKIVNVIFDSNKKYNFLFMKENPQSKELEEGEGKKFKRSHDFGHHVFNLEIEPNPLCDDIPYVYHARALRILNDCLQASDDKQMLKFICQKTLNLSYMFELMSRRNDIYYSESPKALLKTVLEIELMRIVEDVWLTSEKPPSSIFNNKYVTKFLRKQTDNLKNLRKEDIDRFKNSRLSSLLIAMPHENYFAEQRTEENETIEEEEEKEDKADFRLNEGEDEEEEKGENEKAQDSEDEDDEPREKGMNYRERLNYIVKNFTDSYNFDFIYYLFEYVLPLISSLYKLLILNEKSIDEARSRNDVNALTMFSRQFKIFYQEQLKNIDFGKNPRWEKVLQALDKYELLGLDKGKVEESQEMKGEDKRLAEEIEEEFELPLQNIINKNEFEANKNSTWRKFVLNVLVSEHVRDKLIKEERLALIESIKELKNVKSDEKTQVTLENFIKKLVTFLQYGIEKKLSHHHEVLINVIRLLEQILGSFEIEEDEEMQQSQADELKQMQNIMNKCNVTKTILFFLCNKSLPQIIYKSLINLSIKLLEGGNEEVQTNFYDYFISTQNSEHFFQILYNMISHEIAFINKKKSLHERIDISLRDVKYSYKLSDRFSIANILKMLQLLTENHNSKLQNYLRYQTRSRNNYDIPNNIVRLVESLLREFTFGSYSKIMQCLETLTEFIQGPCEKNQIALAEGKLIEIICKLLEEKWGKKEQLLEKKSEKSKRKKKKASNEKKEEERRGTSLELEALNEKTLNDEDSDNESSDRKCKIKITRYLERFSKNYAKAIKNSFDKHSKSGFKSWMLSRLKYKGVITLESLLEGQTDYFIIRRIMKSLSIETLEANLCWIYKKYTKQYGKKYTEHAFNHADLDENKRENKDKLKLIIESGFKIFIILRKYMEMESSEDDEEGNLDILKQELDSILGSDTIVHQIGSLGIDILKTGISAMEKISPITLIWKIFTGKSRKSQVDKEQGEQIESQRLKKDALTFFGKYTIHIEINRGDKLYRQYFPTLPHCLYLDKNIKKNFQNDINRLSVKSKVASLVNKSQDFIDTLKFEEKLGAWFDTNKLFSLLAKYVRLWKDISFIVCITQNVIIMIITCKSADNHTVAFQPLIELYNVSYDIKQLILVLEIIQIVTSSLVLIFFICKRAPLVLKRARDRIGEIEQIHSQSDVEKVSLKSKIFKATRDTLIRIKFLSFDNLVLYYLIYTAFAILGMFQPIFIALLLLDVFSRFPVLLHVVNSLWRPRYQIILTMVLFIILEYYFTLVAYYFFYEDFNNLCEDLWSCFSIIFDQTFKNDGGIGGYFNKQKEEYLGWKLNIKAIYDFLFNFIIIILITQIISGIIIDTFAVLREEEERKLDDMENYCFICGIDRETLDKKSDNKRGFTYHVKIEHNMWNYLFYISYLRDKKKTEYSGFESYVVEKLEADDISWFPLHKALSINSIKEEEEENNSNPVNNPSARVELEEKLDNIEKKVQVLQQLLKPTKHDSLMLQIPRQKSDLR